jgi:hypothetical protein
MISATKVEARTTSNVVTPNNLREDKCLINIEGLATAPVCQPLGIKDTMLLEDFGDDWDGGVYWIRDDEDKRFGSRSCDSGCQITDDACIDLQECCERS